LKFVDGAGNALRDDRGRVLRTGRLLGGLATRPSATAVRRLRLPGRKFKSEVGGWDLKIQN
jgi:hypothetical protein